MNLAGIIFVVLAVLTLLGVLDYGNDQKLIAMGLLLAAMAAFNRAEINEIKDGLYGRQETRSKRDYKGRSRK